MSNPVSISMSELNDSKGKTRLLKQAKNNLFTGDSILVKKIQSNIFDLEKDYVIPTRKEIKTHHALHSQKATSCIIM